MTTTELPRRLFDALVTQIQAHWPEYLRSRFTVAEIYQNLIPWRTHRNTMDIGTSGEYEQALLRLLAGEGDYLALESQAAREEIQAELESRVPNTGLYRDFAAVGVRLNPSRLPDDDAGTLQANAAHSGEWDAPMVAGRDAAARADTAARAYGAADPGPDHGAVGGRVCSGCSQELPAIDGVRFCPFCGQDIRIVACAGCGMTVEAEWSYCVGCGRRARGG